jgi:hypothetical protein
MSQRTTVAAVQGILGGNYGKVNGVLMNLQPFIDSATVIVDRVAVCAAKRHKTLGPAELELVERWLAAHAYCHMDPIYMSKSTAGASASFQRGSGGEGFESTDYGKMAVRIDYSGCLSAIGKRQVARGFAAGVEHHERGCGTGTGPSADPY